MKKSQFAWLLIGIVLVATFGTYLYYQTFVVLAVKAISADVVVKGNPAFNLNDDKFHFGGVPPGQAAERKISISYDRPSRVEISTEGDLERFIAVSETDFFLPAYETKEIIFSVYIPEETPLGNYTGTIFFRFMKP